MPSFPPDFRSHPCWKPPKQTKLVIFQLLTIKPISCLPTSMNLFRHLWLAALWLVLWVKLHPLQLLMKHSSRNLMGSEPLDSYVRFALIAVVNTVPSILAQMHQLTASLRENSFSLEHYATTMLTESHKAQFFLKCMWESCSHYILFCSVKNFF